MRPIILLAMPCLILSGCAGLPGGAADSSSKTALAGAAAGADLVVAGEIVRLVEAVARSSDGVVPNSLVAVLNEAAGGLLMHGQMLKAGGPVGHAAVGDLVLALPSMRQLSTVLTATGSAQAAKAGRVAGYLAAYQAVAASYDIDAEAAKLPKAALSANGR